MSGARRALALESADEREGLESRDVPGSVGRLAVGLTMANSVMSDTNRGVSRWRRYLAVSVLSVVMVWMMWSASGCAIAGVLAHSVAGGERRVKVEADYRDLDDRRVAVLVAADRDVLFYSPQARERVVREVSAGIAEHVSGATLANPRQIAEFQNANPYWTTMRVSRLIDLLEVERVVVIDLVEYRTHDPGNQHIWRGRVTGNVAVHAADARDPDNPAYYRTVTIDYPEDSAIGVVNPDVDQQTIELAMVKVFGRDVVRLFHDHEVTR